MNREIWFTDFYGEGKIEDELLIAKTVFKGIEGWQGTRLHKPDGHFFYTIEDAAKAFTSKDYEASINLYNEIWNK